MYLDLTKLHSVPPGPPKKKIWSILSVPIGDKIYRQPAQARPDRTGRFPTAGTSATTLERNAPRASLALRAGVGVSRPPRGAASRARVRAGRSVHVLFTFIQDTSTCTRSIHHSSVYTWMS